MKWPIILSLTPSSRSFPTRTSRRKSKRRRISCRKYSVVAPAWFRPPYGELRRNQAAIAAVHGLGIVLSSVDSKDYLEPGPGVDQIVAAILSDTHPGSIILCHDLFPHTADSVSFILDGLIARGFLFVSLSELLG